MKATSGEHYVALDHVRALAALLVFVWHFVHGEHGSPVPFSGVPIWGPLVLFDEGHVGVALFMTLSGYLFAKLLDGKKIIYHLFLWNRLLRLMPLLIFVFLINTLMAAFESGNALAAFSYLKSLPRGLVFPSWPNGAWSITVELHFYLLLPLLLLILKRWYMGLWLLWGAFIMVRYCYHQNTGEVQSLAYATIVGRIDQFLCGILAFHGRAHISFRPIWVAGVTAAFFSFYWWFDKSGGFFLQPSYPSPSRLWIIIPAVEGITFGVLIAWYDSLFIHKNGRVSNLLATVGGYSYSIYLLHYYFVFFVARWVHLNFINLNNFYIAFAAAIVFYIGMIPIGYLSMRYLESPLLKLRRKYTKV